MKLVISTNAYDPDELLMGIQVEMEHTDDPKEAEKIAKDHLDENPMYYSLLKDAGLADELTALNDPSLLFPTDDIEELSKGRKPLPEGTIKEWKGGKYQKKNNKWILIGGKKSDAKKKGDKQKRREYITEKKLLAWKEDAENDDEAKSVEGIQGLIRAYIRNNKLKDGVRTFNSMFKRATELAKELGVTNVNRVQLAVGKMRDALKRVPGPDVKPDDVKKESEPVAATPEDQQQVIENTKPESRADAEAALNSGGEKVNDSSFDKAYSDAFAPKEYDEAIGTLQKAYPVVDYTDVKENKVVLFTKKYILDNFLEPSDDANMPYKLKALPGWLGNKLSLKDYAKSWGWQVPGIIPDQSKDVVYIPAGNSFIKMTTHQVASLQDTLVKIRKIMVESSKEAKLKGYADSIKIGQDAFDKFSAMSHDEKIEFLSNTLEKDSAFYGVNMYHGVNAANRDRLKEDINYAFETNTVDKFNTALKQKMSLIAESSVDDLNNNYNVVLNVLKRYGIDINDPTTWTLKTKTQALNVISTINTAFSNSSTYYPSEGITRQTNTAYNIKNHTYRFTSALEHAKRSYEKLKASKKATISLPKTLPMTSMTHVKMSVYNSVFSLNRNDAWENHRQFVKALDISSVNLEAIKDSLDTIYSKGERTSYAKEGSIPVLKDTHGVNVKLQNGKQVEDTHLKFMKKNLDALYTVFGNRSSMAKAYDLTMSYAGEKRMHARKAIGIFMPHFRAIGVSGTDKDAGFTLAHEFAHFMDNYIGAKEGKHFSSHTPNGSSPTTAHSIQSEFAKGCVFNEDKKGYWQSAHECFARALEGYFIFKTEGKNAYAKHMASYSTYSNNGKVETQYYPSPEHFETNVLPKVEAWIKENHDLLKSMRPLIINLTNKE